MDKRECDEWFVTEVLPLEGRVTAYLRRNWRARHEIDDLRQEVYARIYDAARAGRPAHVGSFIMRIARNLLIDRARRERVVSIDFVDDLSRLGEAPELAATERHMTARLELGRLQQVLQTLPPRCREVVELRKIQGLSQREVATRMGITEDTVERQVSKGVRLLADGLYAEKNEADDGPGRRVSLARRRR
ncbi:MAG TPA: hypothetical protein DEH03_06305 [Brevundimonas sp.]|nr:hypothetical protein [Brevundimonas sp.]